MELPNGFHLLNSAFVANAGGALLQRTTGFFILSLIRNFPPEPSITPQRQLAFITEED